MAQLSRSPILMNPVAEHARSETEMTAIVCLVDQGHAALRNLPGGTLRFLTVVAAA